MQENNLSDQDVSRTQIIDTGSNTKLLNDDDTSIHIDAEQVLETILLEDISLPHWKLPCGKSMSCIEGYHKTDEYHTTEDYSSSRETIHLLKRSRSFAPIGIGIADDEDSFKINTKSSVIFRNSLRWSILERVDDKIEEIECEQNENVPVCRICHGSTEDLQYLCECKGTMGPVHAECLSHWLSESGRSCCEICNVRYKVKRILKRPIMETLKGWLFNVVKNNQVFIILSWLMAITPIVLLSSAVCVFCLKQIFLTHNQVRDVHPTLAFFTFTCSVTLVVWYYDMLFMITKAYFENWYLYYLRDHEVEIIIPNTSGRSYTMEYTNGHAVRNRRS